MKITETAQIERLQCDFCEHKTFVFICDNCKKDACKRHLRKVPIKGMSRFCPDCIKFIKQNNIIKKYKEIRDKRNEITNKIKEEKENLEEKEDNSWEEYHNAYKKLWTGN